MQKVRYVFIACFCCFIALIGLKTLENKNTKSTLEGRSLAQFPDLVYTKLTDTKYLNSISDAFSDQIAGRSKIVKGYYNLTANILHQEYIGDVVIGSESRLFSAPEVITDYEKWKQDAVACAKLINEQAEQVTKNGSVFIYINYPKKNVVETKYLPDFYPDERKDYQTFIKIMRENLSESVIFIDAYDIFTSQDEYDCYFITDHHANVRGQQMIYEKVMSIIQQKYPNVEIKTLEDYKIKKCQMVGAFNRKIGNVISAEKEELNLKPDGWKLEYKRNSKVKIFGKLNTYSSAFMGGDYACTEITTKKKDAPSVLICGSSFTNALEALMVPSVSEMVSLDYRHNKDKETVAEKAKEYGSDYVIFIPNQSDAHFSYETVKLHLGIK